MTFSYLVSSLTRITLLVLLVLNVSCMPTVVTDSQINSGNGVTVNQEATVDTQQPLNAIPISQSGNVESNEIESSAIDSRIQETETASTTSAETTTSTPTTTSPTTPVTTTATVTKPIDCENITWRPCNIALQDTECGKAQNCAQSHHCRDIGKDAGVPLTVCFPEVSVGLVV